MIVEIDVSETGQVTDIRGQALGNLSDNLSHVELARQLQDMELASIVIDRERLATELWEDPRYMRHDTHVIVSEVHEEARRRILEASRRRLRHARQRAVPQIRRGHVDAQGNGRRAVALQNHQPQPVR